MFLQIKNRIALIVVVAVSLLPAAAAAVPVAATFETGWHSKYITQGRDNLDEGGVFTAELAVEPEAGALAGTFAGAWFAVGDQQHYQETNLYAGIGRQWGDFFVEAAYTWLHFHPTEEHGEKDDNEFFLAVAYEGWESITLSAEYLHATDADGAQLLMTLTGADAVRAGPVTLSPYAAAAFDYGYSTKEHDGLDYLEAGVAGGVALSDLVELNFYLSHSFARADIEREGEGDKTWAGISIGLNLQE